MYLLYYSHLEPPTIAPEYPERSRLASDHSNPLATLTRNSQSRPHLTYTSKQMHMNAHTAHQENAIGLQTQVIKSSLNHCNLSLNLFT